MKFARGIYIFVLTCLFTTYAFAGAQFFNGSTDLGIFNQVACSTGMTCSRVGPKVLITSSPTLTSGLTITGAEATNATFTMQADESDDNGDDWIVSSVAATNLFTIANDASGSAVTKFSISASAGNVAGPGTGTMSGFLRPIVAATATTITAAQCGSVFLSSGAVEMELPEASAALGCQLTFVVGNASNFTIDPDAADTILLLTNAAGDSLIADAVGEAITIVAVSASQWAVVGAEKGTWTDSD